MMNTVTAAQVINTLLHLSNNTMNTVTAAQVINTLLHLSNNTMNKHLMSLIVVACR